MSAPSKYLIASVVLVLTCVSDVLGQYIPDLPVESNINNRGGGIEQMRQLESTGSRHPNFPLTDAELKNLNPIDLANPYYPVTARYDFHNLTLGQSVLVVRLMECDEKGNFGVLAEGRVVGVEGSDIVLIKLYQNYSMINTFNASSAAWNFAESSKSLDMTTLWCEPVKEFCLKPIQFQKYGLAGEEDAEFVFVRRQIFSLAYGKLMAYQAAVSSFCGKRSLLPAYNKRNDSFIKFFNPR